MNAAHTAAALPPAVQAREAATLAALQDALARYQPAVFASSFGAEDMVLLDLIARHRLPAEVFTLDTGRLPEATHTLMAEARQRYGLPVRVFTPDAAELEAFVNQHGNNAFYNSVELRKQCCAIRKLSGLHRALAGKALWITGLRREQSVTRADTPLLAHDDSHGLMKLNPLVDWSENDVWHYLRAYNVPVSALHAQGYPSIGCAPCTRPVQPGEDPRAGRWWWEQPESRECGLHIDEHGRLVRARKPEAVAPATPF